MKGVRLLMRVLPAVVLLSCSGLFTTSDEMSFITVRGQQLYEGDRPFYFGGTNLWYGCYLGSTGRTGDRDRLLRELDRLKANGLVNVRILGASEQSYIKWAVLPAIQSSPGVVDDSLLQGLDFLLAEMGKRRMRAVIYLNNYWEWSGGMVQYNVWANGGGAVDPEDTTQGWEGFMNFAAEFYSNERANAIYRDYIRRIVTRENSITGKPFCEDPTIMSWQLANEPRPGSVSAKGRENLPGFYRWLDETAAFIHSLDTNHLVSTGSEGVIGSLRSEEYFSAAHQPGSIDYLTFHLWPFNWGWFDPRHQESDDLVMRDSSLMYIAAHLDLARRLNRPIVLEEFGLVRDTGVADPGTPTSARDRFYAMVLSALYDSASAGAPLAGSNFWAWGGEGRAGSLDHRWCAGDDFLGDPPQEPQGLNSVFDTDTSTIQILREHAFRMLRLGRSDTLIVRARDGFP